MATIARGQITIVDLNDAVAINSMLTTNVGLTQLYNKDTKTYTPNWSTGSFLVITPEVFVAGTTSSVMSRVTARNGPLTERLYQKLEEQQLHLPHTP